jgi:flagellar export protein FliJ
MTQARLAPLHTLLEHEERERDAVRARALEARAQAQQARAQAHDLERYRTEQGQRWVQRFRTQGHAEILHCHHSFMLRLDHAVTQQSAAATHAEQRADTVADALRGHEQRVAAVRKLIERQQQSMRLLEQRAEQRREDEFAMRVTTARRVLDAEHDHVRATGAGDLDERTTR